MTRKLSRRDFIGQARSVALATPCLSLLGCGEEAREDLVSLNGTTMGTTYSLKLVDVPSRIDVAALADEVDAVLETVNRQMSTYRQDSEISAFNRAAAGAWAPLSGDSRAVIEEALRVSRLTGGAFDPTVGPVIDLWGFGPDAGEPRVPSAEEIAAAHRMVGYTQLETRETPTAAAKHLAGLRLDLSGVAKGFGVDQVAQYLAARGIENHLVEVGGELRTAGHGPSGQAWRIGIEKPTAKPGDLQRVVELTDQGLATSGDYRLFFEREGRHYSHIVDPKTGRPVEHNLASATVVADTTMEADALSTSLLVLGPEAGMALAEAHDIAAFFIAASGEAFTASASPAFDRRFTT
ncbi:MAG: FAD:protein FMN transferase [Pseudomonadota bacterium]